MMNLLFFGSDYKVGLTTALSEQILELNKINDINLVCVSSENEMEKGLHEKLHNVNMNIINKLDVHSDFFSLASQVEKIVFDNKITHINVHNNWQLAIVSYIKYRKIFPKNFKIIYTIHGYRHNSFVKSIFAICIIGLALLLFADRIISMSSYVSNKFRLLKYKTDIVYYIMSKPEFNKINNKITGNPLKMVFPAQFRKGKNQGILIDAVDNYIKKTSDCSVRLYLPGDGPTLDGYKSKVEHLGLNENIIFPGKMSHKDVIALYEQSNVALVSSNVETYGRCIAEPFALGRCLITKRTGVALDIIKDGKNGFFFSNSSELCKILVSLHKNPSQIVNVGNQAFDDKKIFSKELVISSYLKALEKA